MLCLTGILTCQFCYSKDNNKVPDDLVLTATVKNASCFNRIPATSSESPGDGEITAIASGGIAPYTYWITFYKPEQNNGYFPGLRAGNYQIKVRDAGGTIASTDVYIDNTLPEPILTMEVLQLPSSCTATDGSIRLITSFGTPPYTYSIDGAVTFSSANNLVQNIMQGAYYVFMVKDANGCLAGTITNGARGNSNYFMCYLCCLMDIWITVDRLPCNNESTLTVQTNGSIPPYSFSLDGINYEPANSGGATHTYKNAGPGVYHVFVKTGEGLTGSSSIILNKACTNVLDLTSVSPSCKKANGSITVSAGFGTAPYVYSIDGTNFQLSNVFTDLPEGNYRITVKDATGEFNTGSTTLSASCPSLSLAATAEACGQRDGIITAQATNGTGPYTFSIDGINFQTSNIFTNLTGGDYVIRLMDTKKDTVSETITIPVKCLQLSANVVNSSCTKPDGITTITAANGTPPYQYSIDGINFVSSNMFTGLQADDYNITVKDADGLIASIPVMVAAYEAPQIAANATNAACNNSDGIISITNNNGTAPFQYSIDGGNHFQSDNNFRNLAAGDYTAIIADAHGCADTIAVKVTTTTKPIVDLGKDTILCEGQRLILNAANDGSTYRWQDGSSLFSFMVTNSGTYSVIVEKNGCSISDEITIDYIFKPVINLPPETTLCFSEKIILDASFPNAMYKWQDGSALPQYTVGQPGTYTVQVSNSCGITTGFTEVKYENCNCQFFMPAAFTPDKDNRNDAFGPGWQCMFSEYSLKIFNRFGQILFNATDPSNKWTGSFNGKEQPAGGYVWVLQYKEKLTGRIVNKKGTVLLLR